jgi:CRISPR-associated protein Cmr4
MKSHLYYLHALTPLHAGTGQGDGYIDLPVAREAATGLPLVPGSEVKGVLRDELLPGARDEQERQKLVALFGPDPGNAGEHAGALKQGDARLLCLPVRSWCGTFAWLTCPLVLYRYRRDLIQAKVAEVPEAPPLPEEEAEIRVPEGSVLAWNATVYLKDLDLRRQEDGVANAWAKLIAGQVFPGEEDAPWRTMFLQRFAVAHDAVFDHLCETETDVRPHVSLDDYKTVKDGPWYEESLPPETLLWGIAGLDRSRQPAGRAGHKLGPDELHALLPSETRLQIGGRATVGRGQTRWILV